MFRISLFIFFISFFFWNDTLAQSLWQQQTWKGSTQGTTFRINIQFDDSSLNLITFKKGIDSILHNIDTTFSRYTPNSLLSRFNTSVRGVKLNSSFIELMSFSRSIYSISKGLFDPTVLPLVEYWKHRNPNNLSISDRQELSELKKNIGFSLAIINADSLIKLFPFVKLDFDGIAQGYTVDCLSRYFSANGLNNYLIEIGGEIVVKGIKQIDQMPYRINVATLDPFRENMSTIISYTQGALTTSSNKKRDMVGDYFQHINPLTGYPTLTSIQAVTVYAKNCTIADAYDNVIMQMTPNEAKKFLKKHRFLEVCFTYSKKGRLFFYMTESFRKKIVINGKGDIK